MIRYVFFLFRQHAWVVSSLGPFQNACICHVMSYGSLQCFNSNVVHTHNTRAERERGWQSLMAPPMHWSLLKDEQSAALFPCANCKQTLADDKPSLSGLHEIPYSF